MPQSAIDALFAQLPPDLVANPDEKTFFFIGWWGRMHKRPNPLRMHALKFVEWPADGPAPQRFVWEVCEWPQGKVAKWTFVCWMLDGEGMWLKEFPSQTAAMEFFQQSPAVVMAGDTNVRDGAQRRRAS